LHDNAKSVEKPRKIFCWNATDQVIEKGIVVSNQLIYGLLPLLGEGQQHNPSIFFICGSNQQAFVDQLVDNPGDSADGKVEPISQWLHGQRLILFDFCQYVELKRRNVQT